MVYTLIGCVCAFIFDMCVRGFRVYIPLYWCIRLLHHVHVRFVGFSSFELVYKLCMCVYTRA